MPDEAAAEKTEQPTPRRLTKARVKGKVTQSEELTTVVTLLVLVIMVALLAPGLMRWFIMQMKQGMSWGSSFATDCKIAVFADSKVFMNFINTKIVDSIHVLWPIFAALCVGSALAGVAVSGLNFAPGAIQLKFDQLNPAAGLAKLVNAHSMVKLLTSILKLFFVSVIVWFYLHSKLDTLDVKIDPDDD